jgi:hypothetical protein
MYNIYDAIDDGENIQDIISDMSLDEMEEFFADADPIMFL